MTAIAIRVDGKQLRVHFPYDADAVNQLKDAVPAYARSFDSQTKGWTVDAKWLPQLTDAMAAGGHTIVDGNAPPPPKPSSTGVAEFFGATDGDKAEAKIRAQAILESIPPPLRHRTFREIARLLYPDLYSGRR